MPQYVYQCRKCGDNLLRWCTVKNFTDQPNLSCQSCDVQMSVIIQPPLLVKAAPDVCYDSPIDGSHITSWDKRREDLKRNGCREYDPGMKQDYHQRIQESEASLEKNLASTIEETIEKMPTAKRGKLYSELTDQGLTTDVVKA